MGFFTKTIYKKDSKNKLRLLTIMSRDGVLTQESGLVGGKTIIRKSNSKPKNVGRSNATTAEQQAELEARAIIVKKLKQGYFDTQQEALDSEVLLPMLANEFNAKKHKIDWKNDLVLVQPKLDGMRCLQTKDGKISRKNTPIENVDHIKVQTNIDGEDIVVDGELYVHGLSFQENMKLVKKYRPGDTENVKFHVYDIVKDVPYLQRMVLLRQVVIKSTNCEKVVTKQVYSEADIDKYHKQFLSEGYEGTIVRWGDAGYAINKRSDNLLKYKDFIDEAYEVVDVEPSDKNPEQGIVICKNNNGDTFGCGMKFSHKEREEILTNKHDYIGKTAEVRFFEYTDDGLPRFPVCYGFRLDR